VCHFHNAIHSSAQFASELFLTYSSPYYINIWQVQRRHQEKKLVILPMYWALCIMLLVEIGVISNIPWTDVPQRQPLSQCILHSADLTTTSGTSCSICSGSVYKLGKPPLKKETRTCDQYVCPMCMAAINYYIVWNP